MSLRQVLTIYNAERQLTDDETALLNTLRRMNDNERQMFVEGLSGKAAGKKGSKKAAGKGASKSPRASSLQQRIQGRVKAASTNGGPCTFRYPDDAPAYAGQVCTGDSGNPIHDPLMGYAGYHEFQAAEQAASASGD